MEAPKRIEVRIRRLAQLFNSLDPSPFIERDLDDDAESFLFSWAKELGPEHGYEIVIHVKEHPAKDRVLALESAVRHFFTDRAQAKERELGLLLRQGRTSLIVGLSFLSTCLFLSSLLGRMDGSAVVDVAKESLAIGGWVAMWRPLQTYLYDWWPLKDDATVLRSLAKAKVILVSPGEAETSTAPL